MVIKKVFKSKNLRFFNQQSVENKRKIREKLDFVIEQRKQQRQIVIDNIIKPIDLWIATVEDVKKSKIPLEFLIKKSKKFNKYITGLMSK